MTPDERTSQGPFDIGTGMFTAPSGRKYQVTVTAMLTTPSQPGLVAYAQLFLRKNKKVDSLDHYLLVESGKVADMRTEVNLNMGDTLSVYVGHQITHKYMMSPSGSIEVYQ